MQEEFPQLTVARQSPKDVGIRQVVVTLDGQPFATLRHGDTVTRSVAPGAHHLKIHNTLVWKNLDVALAPGEHVRYGVINRAGWGTQLLVAMLGVGPLYLTVNRE